jgi:hypothetical protein
MAIRGALGVSMIDYTSGLVLGSAGRCPSGDFDVTAAGAAKVVQATVDGGAFATLGSPSQVDDIIVTARNGYHLVHFLATGFDARLVLYVWLDPAVGNLAMAQRLLRSITGSVVTS